MFTKVIRVLGGIVLGAAGAWLGRLIAHSKEPPPEGRWREIRREGGS